jgi:hypothetical protein
MVHILHARDGRGLFFHEATSAWQMLFDVNKFHKKCDFFCWIFISINGLICFKKGCFHSAKAITNPLISRKKEQRFHAFKDI